MLLISCVSGHISRYWVSEHGVEKNLCSLSHWFAGCLSFPRILMWWVETSWPWAPGKVPSLPTNWFWSLTVHIHLPCCPFFLLPWKLGRARKVMAITVPKTVQPGPDSRVTEIVLSLLLAVVRTLEIRRRMSVWGSSWIFFACIWTFFLKNWWRDNNSTTWK